MRSCSYLKLAYPYHFSVQNLSYWARASQLSAEVTAASPVPFLAKLYSAPSVKRSLSRPLSRRRVASASTPASSVLVLPRAIEKLPTIAPVHFCAGGLTAFNVVSGTDAPPGVVTAVALPPVTDSPAAPLLSCVGTG